MRLLLLSSLSLWATLALSCAQSENTVGGGAGGGGGFAAVDGGGVGGGKGGSGGSSAFGGSAGMGGALGGAAGAGGSSASGGSGGATGGTGGSSASGGTGGATGGTGGTGGGNCTPPVAGGQCDTFPQCGCSATDACYVTSFAGTTQCLPVGVVPPYNKCQYSDDCTKGYACVGSACKAFCEQNTDCTQTSGTCIQVMNNSTTPSTPVPGMKVCSKKCKLENPASDCGPGLSCYPDIKAGTTDCATGGTATGPGQCLAPNQTACAPGYACLDNGDCRKWCRVGMTTDCGGKACQGFSTAVVVYGQEYGVCAP